MQEEERLERGKKDVFMNTQNCTLVYYFWKERSEHICFLMDSLDFDEFSLIAAIDDR